MLDVQAKAYGKLFGKKNLNVGCGLNQTKSTPDQEWINLDMNPDVKPDVLHALGSEPLPFAGELFDCVFASHVFEHLDGPTFVLVIADIYRILKPGGYLIGITPHGSNDSAWENPHHLQLFTENTWFYVTKDAYGEKQRGTVGYGASQGADIKDWTIEQIILTPLPEFINDPRLEEKAKHQRNVLNEVHAVLRRPE